MSLSVPGTCIASFFVLFSLKEGRMKNLKSPPFPLKRNESVTTSERPMPRLLFAVDTRKILSSKNRFSTLNEITHFPVFVSAEMPSPVLGRFLFRLGLCL